MPGSAMEEEQRRAQARRVKQKGSRRCYPALPPVIEHYEAPAECEAMASLNSTESEAPGQTGPNEKKVLAKRCKKGRNWILSKLCDAYVKLMNDMASSADYAGVSSFYGSPAGVEFHARRREERERKILRDLQMQLARSPQLANLSS